MSVRKVTKAGHVTWQIEIVTRLGNGKKQRVRRYAKRQDEARRIEAELRAGVEKPAPAEPQVRKEVITLAKFAVEFIRDYATANNRPSTTREKQGCLDRAILPALGRLRLDEIGPREIETYKAARLRAGLAAKTVNEEVGIIGKMLRTAHEWNVIDRVPRIRRLKTPAPDFDFLDFEEADRLIAAATAEPDPWGAMIVTALRTGLRQGELRGLRWQDVDTIVGRIVVRVAADDKGELHPPKSGKPREVPLGDEVLLRLRAHRHLRGQFVFCNADGSMLSQRQVERPIARACRRAGLRSVGWHALRHSFASQLVMRGATLRAVQDLLGHATVGMTLRYAHLSPDARRDAVRLLDRGDQRGATTGATAEATGTTNGPGGCPPRPFE